MASSSLASPIAAPRRALPESPLWKWLAPLFLVVLLPLSLRAVYRDLSMPGFDSGVFLYEGQHWLRGEMPYRDMWDHKGPLIYAFDAVGLLLGRGDWHGLLLLEWLWLGAALWMLFAALSSAFSRPAAFAGCAVYAIAAPTFLNDVGNMTESWNFGFQALAMLALVHLIQRKTPAPAWSAALGLCGAGALLLRPNLAVVFVGATLLWMLRARPSRGELVAFALALVLPVVATGVYLRQNGAWEAMKDQYFAYNAVYSNYPGIWGARVHALAYNFKMLVSWRGAFLGFVGLIPALALVRRTSRASSQEADEPDSSLKLALGWLLVIGIPLELLAASLSGYQQPHYLLPALTLLALGVAFAFDWLSERTTRRREEKGETKTRSNRSWINVALCLWLALCLSRIAWDWRVIMRTPRVVTPQVALARFLANHTTAGQSVLLWGSETRVYLMANRKSASRYIYILPLLNPKYGTAERGREFVQDAERARPPIVVDLHDSGIDLATGKASVSEVSPAMRVVASSLLRDYEWRGEILPGPDGAQWKIYRRRSSRSKVAGSPQPSSAPKLGGADGVREKETRRKARIASESIDRRWNFHSQRHVSG